MLLEKELVAINENPPSLHEILVENCPTLILLPKLESLINKEEPTLEDILTTCSHDESLLTKLTRRSGFVGNEEQFARDILFKKGLGFLKSLAIRTMNQEIFELPLGLNGMSTHLIKRRSVILARFLKRFVGDLDREPDDLYLAGLLYNYPYVTYEHMLKVGSFSNQDFDEVRGDCIEMTCSSLHEINVEPYVVGMIEDSVSDLYETRNPFEHALLRIANEVLERAEQSNSTLGRGKSMNRNLLDATGYTEREILNLLKELSKNYKGTATVPWQS